MKIDGFDDLRKFLNNLQKKVENAGGEVSFPDLFNPSFMTTFTNFSSIGEFFDKSPFEVKSMDDFEQLDEATLDEYVNANSKFSSWEEMKAEAGKLYSKGQLGL